AGLWPPARHGQAVAALGKRRLRPAGRRVAGALARPEAAGWPGAAGCADRRRGAEARPRPPRRPPSVVGRSVQWSWQRFLLSVGLESFAVGERRRVRRLRGRLEERALARL